MFNDEDDDKNSSFNSQVADGFSSDPARRSTSGNTIADSISQGMANSVAGNHPDWERWRYGRGTIASKTAQDQFDDVFAPKRKREDSE